MAFLLSVIALLLGPFVYVLGRRRPTVHEMLNGLIFITIAGIVCVHIIPEALDAGGLFAFVFLLLGLAFPIVIEHGFTRHLGKAHAFVLGLAGLGLVIHASIDGLALASVSPVQASHPSHSATLLDELGGRELALGVILHRLPVGMAIWWSLRPHFGTGIAVGALLLIVVATAATYFQGADLWSMTEARSVAYFQAFVAGSLVHIAAFGVSHDHDKSALAPPSQESHPWSYRVGILLGMFLIFAAPHTHI